MLLKTKDEPDNCKRVTLFSTVSFTHLKCLAKLKTGVIFTRESSIGSINVLYILKIEVSLFFYTSSLWGNDLVYVIGEKYE